MLHYTVYRNSQQRVGIFVDVQNMFYSAKTLHQSKIDYSKLLESILCGRQLVRAVAYVVQKPDVDQSSFVEALQRAGYEVRCKEMHVRGDGTSRGDWDVGIVLDTMSIAPRLDTVVLVTGDGDFAPLAATLRARGCRVEVVSFDASTSGELIRAADQFIPIDEAVLFRERKFLRPDGVPDRRSPPAYERRGEPGEREDRRTPDCRYASEPSDDPPERGNADFDDDDSTAQ